MVSLKLVFALALTPLSAGTREAQTIISHEAMILKEAEGARKKNQRDGAAAKIKATEKEISAMTRAVTDIFYAFERHFRAGEWNKCFQLFDRNNGWVCVELVGKGWGPKFDESVHTDKEKMGNAWKAVQTMYILLPPSQQEITTYKEPEWYDYKLTAPMVNVKDVEAYKKDPATVTKFGSMVFYVNCSNPSKGHGCFIIKQEIHREFSPEPAFENAREGRKNVAQAHHAPALRKEEERRRIEEEKEIEKVRAKKEEKYQNEQDKKTRYQERREQKRSEKEKEKKEKEREKDEKEREKEERTKLLEAELREFMGHIVNGDELRCKEALDEDAYLWLWYPSNKHQEYTTKESIWTYWKSLQVSEFEVKDREEIRHAMLRFTVTFYTKQYHEDAQLSAFIYVGLNAEGKLAVESLSIDLPFAAEFDP